MCYEVQTPLYKQIVTKNLFELPFCKDNLPTWSFFLEVVTRINVNLKHVRFKDILVGIPAQDFLIFCKSPSDHEVFVAETLNSSLTASDCYMQKSRQQLADTTILDLTPGGGLEWHEAQDGLADEGENGGIGGYNSPANDSGDYSPDPRTSNSSSTSRAPRSTIKHIEDSSDSIVDAVAEYKDPLAWDNLHFERIAGKEELLQGSKVLHTCYIHIGRVTSYKTAEEFYGGGNL